MPGKQHERVVALVGNPNAGKTSVFNALTGARQKTGNYPGVTVERTTGRLKLDVSEIEVVDVPGLYSLQPVSADEEVALETLSDENSRPDVLVYVLDASNLERNLFLYSQIVELDIPLVVAVTMTDMLAQSKTTLDLARLQSHLGAPVVAIVPHKGVGVADLKTAISQELEDADVAEIAIGFPSVVVTASEGLVEHFSRYGAELSLREARCVILDEKCTTYDRFLNNPELTTAIDEARVNVLGKAGRGKTIDSQTRYAWASHIKKECLSRQTPEGRTRTARIDAVVTHRVFGPLIFAAVMYAVFQSIYTLAQPLMDLITKAVAALGSLIAPALSFSPVVKSLILDGLLKGVGSVIVFLPQIIILFFFIAVLEGTGYLARAAFLMDRLLGWAGLNGRAFIPLLSSFACAVPGILSARVMPDNRSRLATVLVAPLMSCSARLPVYVLMIGAIIEPKYGAAWAGFALFCMHLIGLVVAVPVVLILNKGILKGKRLPFVLELPPYQWPKWKDVALTLASRVRVFLHTAGTIIVVMSVLIWGLLYFPQGDQKAYAREYASLPAARQASVTLENYSVSRQRQDSLLGGFGRALEPAFKPAGFDWRLTTCILAAFPAREVVVPAMGIIFEQGETTEATTSLQSALQTATWPDGRPLITPVTAVSMMVFFALCCQCMATLATIRRETGSWKWPAFAFCYMTGLAYAASLLIEGIGRALHMS